MTIKKISQDEIHRATAARQDEPNRAGRVMQPTVYAGRSPYIGDDGYWYEWSDEAQDYVRTEYQASKVEVTQLATSGAEVAIINGVKLYTPTTTAVSVDNTLPITSAGVYTIVGNIDVLLSKI